MPRRHSDIKKVHLKTAESGNLGRTNPFALNKSGPQPDGLIQTKFVERLSAIGRWMDRNGESIYGTRYGPIQGLSSVPETDWRKMKIEHWLCQHKHSNRQLDYRNLLGGCMGGEDKPDSEKHCDTRKGNKRLKWNPADPSHRIETRVEYDLEGRISSPDAEFDRELNEVLGLNLKRIMNNRKYALWAMLEWWKAERDRRRNRPPKAVIKNVINRMTSSKKLEPYSQVAVWFLRQRLAERVHQQIDKRQGARRALRQAQ
jgi:hypothetical protein